MPEDDGKMCVSLGLAIVSVMLCQQ